MAELPERGVYALPGARSRHALSLAHTGEAPGRVAWAFGPALGAVAEKR